MSRILLNALPLVEIVSVGLPVEVHAIELSCPAPVDTFHIEEPAADPIVSLYVSRSEAGVWKIREQLKSGKIVDREEEYPNIQDDTDDLGAGWSGTARGRPNILGGGTIRRNYLGEKFTYKESVFDRDCKKPPYFVISREAAGCARLDAPLNQPYQPSPIRSKD